MFKPTIMVTTVQDRRPATELNTTPEEMLYLLHEAPRDEIKLIGDHKEFI